MKLTALSALSHRNFRLFIIGQLISLTGVWAQRMAQAWLVYDLTHSPAWLGIIDAATMLPMTIFSLLGGAFADRHSKKKLLIILYAGMMVIAALYAGLVFEEVVTVSLIGLLAVMTGTLIAFEVPVRQSYYIELVGKRDLSNAIAINSATFNMARLLGPAFGGMMVATLGVAWCMLFNAVSYVAILLALSRIPPSPAAAGIRQVTPFMLALKQVWSYVRRNPQIASLLILISVTTIFGWSYIVILPVIAREVLGGEAALLGHLMSAAGLGAFSAATIVAFISHRYLPVRLCYVGLGVLIFAAAGLALSRQVAFSLLSVGLAGFGLIMFYVNANSALQRRAPHELRGRIMGIYAFAFGGLMPLGSLQMGYIAEFASVRTAIILGAVFLSVFALLLMRILLLRPPEVAA